jgi:hypothetical protein
MLVMESAKRMSSVLQLHRSRTWQLALTRKEKEVQIKTQFILMLPCMHHRMMRRSNHHPMEEDAETAMGAASAVNSKPSDGLDEVGGTTPRPATLSNLPRWCVCRAAVRRSLLCLQLLQHPPFRVRRRCSTLATWASRESGVHCQQAEHQIHRFTIFL